MNKTTQRKRESMNILAFESSCDETAVAVVRDGRQVLSDAILSQADMHAIYGGVVPEIASRSHITVVSRLAEEALREAGLDRGDIDAIAVTAAPGLIGALLVGVNFAKGAALALGVPLIPVHHVRGHIAANYLAFPELEPPFLCVAISGGNTAIVDVRGCWACPTPEACPCRTWRRAGTTGPLSCPGPKSRGTPTICPSRA